MAHFKDNSAALEYIEFPHFNSNKQLFTFKPNY